MTVLYNLHIAAAIIHAISCVLAVVVHTDTITGVLTLPHHKYMADNNAVIAEHVINATVTHEAVIYTHPMVWIAANEGFTFFSHCIALCFLRKRLSEIDLNEMELSRRTVEYMFTAGILQVALVLGIGKIAIYDAIMLLLINACLQGLGWIQDQRDFPPRLKPYILTAAFVLLAVEIQYVIFQTTNIEGIEVGPYIVMGIFYAIFYLLFGFVKLIDSWKKNENEIYILMSVTSKVALSWILIGNTYAGMEELGVESKPNDFTDLDWRTIQVFISVVSGLVLAVGIYYFTRDTSSERKMRIMFLHS
jgi:hypothetical protein